MKKENFEKMIKYENKFNQVVFAQFVDSLSHTEFEEIKDVFISEGYYEPITFNCGSCVIKMIDKVGRLFLDQKVKNQQEVEILITPIKGRKNKK